MCFVEVALCLDQRGLSTSQRCSEELGSSLQQNIQAQEDSSAVARGARRSVRVMFY